VGDQLASRLVANLNPEYSGRTVDQPAGLVVGQVRQGNLAKSRKPEPRFVGLGDLIWRGRGDDAGGLARLEGYQHLIQPLQPEAMEVERQVVHEEHDLLVRSQEFGKDSVQAFLAEQEQAPPGNKDRVFRHEVRSFCSANQFDGLAGRSQAVAPGDDQSAAGPQLCRVDGLAVDPVHLPATPQSFPYLL
jgi:hypothetical protein